MHVTPIYSLKLGSWTLVATRVYSSYGVRVVRTVAHLSTSTSTSRYLLARRNYQIIEIYNSRAIYILRRYTNCT